MALREWIVGVVGLFAAWIALTFLTGVIGTMWGIYGVLNQTGIMDPGWDQHARTIKAYFDGLWSYIPLIVLLSVVVYIIIGSIRRDPNEYYI